jgi:hypothetical protein
MSDVFLPPQICTFIRLGITTPSHVRASLLDNTRGHYNPVQTLEKELKGGSRPRSRLRLSFLARKDNIMPKQKLEVHAINKQGVQPLSAV